jgi:hypothetical protein
VHPEKMPEVCDPFWVDWDYLNRRPGGVAGLTPGYNLTSLQLVSFSAPKPNTFLTNRPESHFGGESPRIVRANSCKSPAFTSDIAQ